MASITASSRDATAIPQLFRINTSRQHPARRTASAHRAPPDVQQLFVRAADLQLDFDPSR